MAFKREDASCSDRDVYYRHVGDRGGRRGAEVLYKHLMRLYRYLSKAALMFVTSNSLCQCHLKLGLVFRQACHASNINKGSSTSDL